MNPTSEDEDPVVYWMTVTPCNDGPTGGGVTAREDCRTTTYGDCGNGRSGAT